MKPPAPLILALVLMGAGWGLTQPLAKIAVSGGYQPLGLIFWQMVIAAAVLSVVVRLRGKKVPIGAAHLRLYLTIALIGTIVPGFASYRALVHLPSGIISILLSLVPMIAFPVALALGNDRFGWLRMSGLMVGLSGVLLLVVPEAGLPEPGMVYWIPLALVAPLCYGFEGNYVARWGTAGLDPLQVLLGASVVGAALSLPLAIFAGHWISPLPPYGAPDLAFVASSVIHAFVYSAYVWLVRRAGPSFAAQVSYLVTGFGVLWAMLLLGENYSTYVWGAMALMFVGIFLVQPRDDSSLAPASASGDTGQKTMR